LEVKVALDRIIEKIKSNGMLRVVVLRGEGRAFCSGGDLRSIKNKEGMGRPEDLRSSHSILRKLLNLEPVVISVVHGFAMGAGCNLALAADLVYAARGTKFGQAFVNLGLVPDWGGMFFLPRLAGIRKAKEWIFFGQTFDAEEALSCGLINGVLAPDSLVPEVLEKAKRLAAGPWTAIRFAKRTLDQISERGLEAVFEAEIDGFGKCMASPDFQEGLTAFLEKRKPIFG
jgi:2-(1,2-epoxy-1,2-dihydrophenyl)acetyl-CoA isomerase